MSQPQILRGMLVEKVFVCWECLLNVENVSGGTRRTPMKFTAELDMAALRDPQEIILGMIGKKQKRKKQDLWRFRCCSNPEGWIYCHIILIFHLPQTQRVEHTFISCSFFTFHCLDPLFEVHKGVVFNLLHSLNSTESANGTVPSTSKAIKDMKCMWCSAPLKCFSKVLLGHSSSQIPKKLSLTGWVLNLDWIQRERWEEDKISSRVLRRRPAVEDLHPGHGVVIRLILNSMKVTEDSRFSRLTIHNFSQMCYTISE